MIVLYLTLLALLLKRVYLTAESCTMKFKLVYGRLKRFFTLSLRNDLVICSSPDLIELCYFLVYSKQFNVYCSFMDAHWIVCLLQAFPALWCISVGKSDG